MDLLREDVLAGRCSLAQPAPCALHGPYSRQWVTLSLWAVCPTEALPPGSVWWSLAALSPAWVLCPALPCCLAVLHRIWAILLAGPQPCSGWGSALHLGGLREKPFRYQGCSPLVGLYLLTARSPWLCTHRLLKITLFCLKVKPGFWFFFPYPLHPHSFMLLKLAWQELFFLKGFIFHCR